MFRFEGPVPTESEGAEASVTVPGETAAKIYAPGTYRIERRQLP